jgi:hypothetical protein
MGAKVSAPSSRTTSGCKTKRTDRSSSEFPLPEQYVAVHLAGKGEDGEVTYCLPKQALDEARGTISTSTQRDTRIAALKSQLVAVKTSSDSLHFEVERLEAIHELAGGDARRHQVVNLIAAEQASANKDFCGWMALSTAAGSFTVRTLCQVNMFEGNMLPEELVFHIFMQVREVLCFLQSCDPPITHFDHHAGNILVDPSRRDAYGFPHLTLIDFSRARMPATQKNINCDRWRFYRHAVKLARYSTPTEARIWFFEDPKSDWERFLMFLNTWHYNYKVSDNNTYPPPEFEWDMDDVVSILEDGWEEMEAMMVRRKANTPPKTLKAIQGAVAHYAADGERMIEQGLQKLLETRGE